MAMVLFIHSTFLVEAQSNDLLYYLEYLPNDTVIKVYDYSFHVAFNAGASGGSEPISSEGVALSLRFRELSTRDHNKQYCLLQSWPPITSIHMENSLLRGAVAHYSDLNGAFSIAVLVGNIRLPLFKFLPKRFARNYPYELQGVSIRDTTWLKSRARFLPLR